MPNKLADQQFEEPPKPSIWDPKKNLEIGLKGKCQLVYQGYHQGFCCTRIFYNLWA